jgi:hypothetical protein
MKIKADPMEGARKRLEQALNIAIAIQQNLDDCNITLYKAFQFCLFDAMYYWAAAAVEIPTEKTDGCNKEDVDMALKMLDEILHGDKSNDK